MRDLFGNDISVEEARRMVHGRGRISKSGKKRYDLPNGYAARPGSGPKGEFCRTCVNAVKVNGGRRDYWKCLLLRRVWSAGPGTDIRLKAPACQFWKAKEVPA